MKLDQTRWGGRILICPTIMYQTEGVQCYNFCLYLRRYNVRVEADVWLNRSSVSVISRPYLDNNSFLEIFLHHCYSSFNAGPFHLQCNDDHHHRQLDYPVVKHVDEGGVVVHGLPHHSLPQPLPIKLHWLTIRT